eukprot:scaffold1581_cov169-Amphora_coffeaeformis.AAC.10
MGQQGPPLPLPPKKKKKTSCAPPPVSSSQQQRLYPMLAGTGQFPPMGTGLPQNVLLPAGMAYNGGATTSMPGVVFPNQGAIGTGAVSAAGMPVPPIHQHQWVQPSKSSGGDSSNFFKGWELRSGKWLKEEEAYAELLIRMFDRGQLSDCVTGSTMRAYLAQKLHCAPMRISKKFAGRGIGKKVYCCRIDNTGSNNVTPEVAEHSRKMQNNVEEAKKAFQDAASADAPNIQATASMISGGFLPLMTSPSGMQFPMPAIAAAQQFFPQMNQAACFFANNRQGLQSFSAMANAAATSIPAQMASTVVPVATGMQPTFQQTTQHQQLQEQVVPANARPSTAQQLQQSYISAVTNHPLNTKAPHPQNTSGSNGGIQTVGNAQISARSEHPDADPNLTNHAWPSRLHQGDTQTNGGKVCGAQTSTNTPQTSSIPNQGVQVGSGFHPSEVSASVLPTAVTSRNARAPSAHFPDFAAGFDSVALSVMPASTNASPIDEQQALQCSPPFTSRSFDDFHRLLGNDIGPLDDGAAGAALADSPRPSKGTTGRIEDKSSPEKVFLDSSALFTAESYAMFAQESALAASQHAAYLAQDHKVNPSENRHFGSFDFDSTMKLLHQHVPVASRKDSMPPASSLPEIDAKPQALVKPLFPFQRNADRQQNVGHKIEIKMPSTTTAGLVQTRVRRSTPVVSSSEPTSSANESSVRGTTSESNGSDNTFSNSDDGQFNSGDDSDSSDNSFSCEDASESMSKRRSSISSSQYDESWNHHGAAEHKKRRLSGDLNGGQ